MNIATNLPVLGCIMVLCGMGLGCGLAALKSRTIDIIVGVVLFLMIAWILLSIAAPVLHWF
jgi:hypothetical protein